jgi:hypothetical protein
MMTKILFWFQVIMAWIYIIPQVIHLINGKTAGLNLAIWSLFIGYLLVGLSLSILSYREKPEPIRRYTVIIFAQWAVFLPVLLIIGFQHIHWTVGDTIVSSSALVLYGIVLLRYRSFKDEMSRGWLAVLCKGIPQLWVAWTMIQANSSEWLPPLSLLATNMTMLPRFFQVYWQGQQGGWDRATKGLMLGETANVVTWLVVTAVWFFLR